MAVRYLDGARLRRSATAAARWVSQRQENLNGINVFPVPDGDTGTNLSATLVAASERARRVQGRSLAAVSRALADGALFGACGNSGVILAQFFEGFAESLEGRHREAGPGLAVAVERASGAAASALAHPREGTILTVMRAWAGRFAARARAGPEPPDLLEAFRDSVEEARAALARTPEQLRELARAGVVDAGAQGFVYLLEGILHFAEGRVSGGGEPEPDRAEPLVHAAVERAAEEIGFRFCTEVLVEGESLSLEAVRAAVEPLGDSLVVAGSPRRMRVHVHTDHPERVFAAAGEFGRTVRSKADDMRAQHVARFDARDRVAIVTDTAADIPEHDLQRLRIHVVPLRVLVGGAVYLDKQTLAPDEVYERLVRGERMVRTSQPAPGDYAALYRYLFEHYGAILVPSLSEALSGTIQAARTAARGQEGEVRVLDTGCASIAQGLIVLAAAERAMAGGDLDAVAAAAEEARGRVRLVLGVRDIEFLVRGGRLSGWKAALIGRLKLAPILTLDPRRGVPRLAGLARRGRAHAGALARAQGALAREAVAPSRIWIAHAAAPEVAEAFRAALAAVAPAADIEIVEVGPALGTHAGPGAVGVSWLSTGGRK